MGPEVWTTAVVAVVVIGGAFAAIRHKDLADRAETERRERDRAIRRLAEALADDLSEGGVAVDRLSAQSNLASNDVQEAKKLAYERILQRISADGEITEEEVQRIDAVKAALRLSSEHESAVAHTVLLPRLKSLVIEAIKDRRVTKEELAEIEETARKLRVKFELQGDVSQFEKFVAYARWEDGELPTVPAPVSLQRGEVCHFAAPAEFWELKTTRTRVSYSGMSYSIRIAKGVYYRTGTVSPRYTETTNLVKKDEGQLVLTSKRLIFVGTSGAKAMTWNAILEIHPFSDAIRVVKSSGKYPVFKLQEAEDVSVLSSVLLNA